MLNAECRFYHDNPQMLPGQFRNPSDAYKAPPPHLDKATGAITHADGTVTQMKAKPMKAAPPDELLHRLPGWVPKARGPVDL